MHFDCSYKSTRLDRRFKKPFKDVSKIGNSGTLAVSCVEPGIQSLYSWFGGDHCTFSKMKMLEKHYEALSEALAEDHIRIYKFKSNLV